jgi:hypothetical protein
MKNKVLLAALVSLSAFTINAQESKNEVYLYKKYERFDLGDLEVKGELIAPGDISVDERERVREEMDLFIRKQSQDLADKEVENLR